MRTIQSSYSLQALRTEKNQSSIKKGQGRDSSYNDLLGALLLALLQVGVSTLIERKERKRTRMAISCCT